jgi:hypothetical protein
MSQLINIVSQLSYWFNWFFCGCDCQAIIPHLRSMWHNFVIYLFICFIIMFNSFFLLTCCLWFFPIDQCLYFKILHLKFNRFVWFQFVDINQHGIGFKCDLLTFGNHKTKWPNLNYFFVFFYWFHKALFHYCVPNFTLNCNLFSCNSSSFETLLVKIFSWFPSLWSLLITSRMYSIGIKLWCNP